MSQIEIIINTLLSAQKKEAFNTELVSTKDEKHENNFLFILKPEIFYSNNTETIRNILTYIINKIALFGLHIDNIRMLNACYLSQNKTISKHYGVINAVARDWERYITQEAVDNFKLIYNRNIDNETVYGSLEILEAGIGVDKNVLSELWKNCKTERLAGGIYSGKVSHNGKTIFIINGFHPPQLSHFIENGRVIVTMNLSGNLDWVIARQKLIGNTYPEKAEKGTIRYDLYKFYGKMGFEDVSYVINSVHLSAGPIEGLLEQMTFNNEKNIDKFQFGQQLLQNFSESVCAKILSNPIISFEDKEVSLFDLTEEKNSNEAIRLLKSIFK